MVNQRHFLHPSETSTGMTLRGRLYSARLCCPTDVSIHTLCTSSNPQNIRYPCVESVMDGSLFQPHVHDIYVHVSRPRRILFRVFFKRHVMLRYNSKLDLQGDIVIMRVASRNKQSVVNLRTSDRRIADAVVQVLSPALRRFQGPQRTHLPHELSLDY